jgi:hypothetical protein
MMARTKNQARTIDQSVQQSTVTLEVSGDQERGLTNRSRCGTERFKEAYNLTEPNKQSAAHIQNQDTALHKPNAQLQQHAWCGTSGEGSAPDPAGTRTCGVEARCSGKQVMALHSGQLTVHIGEADGTLVTWLG